MFADDVVDGLEREDRRFVVARPSVAETSPREVEALSIQLYFPTSPTASTLAASLEDVDRQARRIATAFLSGQSIDELYGRGKRLLPRAQGLTVEEARRGSLDVSVGLGAIAGIVLSDPVSFALNLLSLLDYGKAAVRAVTTRSTTELDIQIERPVDVAQDDDPHGTGPQPGVLRVAAEGVLVEVPDTHSAIRIRIAARDGSSVEIDAGPGRHALPEGER